MPGLNGERQNPPPPGSCKEEVWNIECVLDKHASAEGIGCPRGGHI